MMEYETVISSLERKIRALVSIVEQLRRENDKLSGEIVGLHHVMEAKDSEIKEIRDKYEQLKLARLLVTGSEDVHSAKLKVNKIVRDIDKCIALLNK